MFGVRVNAATLGRILIAAYASQASACECVNLRVSQKNALWDVVPPAAANACSQSDAFTAQNAHSS